MPGPSTIPRLLRWVALGGTLRIVAGACSSGGSSSALGSASSAESEQVTLSAPVDATVPAVLATQAAVNGGGSPPAGTIALRRDAKPVFTGEAADVEKAFRANLDAYQRKDVDIALGNISKEGQQKRPTSRADLADFMDSFRIVLYRVTNIAVDGTRATVDYENAIVGRNLKSDVTTLLAQHDVWVKEGGTWKFLSDVSSSPGIPEDLKAVPITMRDGRQITVPVPLPKGEFAISVTNAGAATKGLFILGIPADRDVPSLLKEIGSSDRMPDHVLEMGAISDIAAGSTGAMVFSGALHTGRYVLVARSTEDEYHRTPLLPGEYAEFSVQ